MMTYQDVVKKVFNQHKNSSMTPQNKMKLASKTWSKIKKQQGGSMETANLKGGKLTKKQKDYLKNMGKGAVVGGVGAVGALGHHLFTTPSNAGARNEVMSGLRKIYNL